MFRRFVGALVLIATLALVGCGEKKAEIDPEPFRGAIVDYLKAGNMGMAVHEFKEIVADGDRATAKVSLNAADVPQVKVRWVFVFERAGDSWRVVSHKE